MLEPVHANHRAGSATANAFADIGTSRDWSTMLSILVLLPGLPSCGTAA